MESLIEAIRRKILHPFTAVLTFKNASAARSMDLKRLAKRILHPYSGEAWFESHSINGNGKYPHIHLITAVDAEQASTVEKQLPNRVAALSNGEVRVAYIKTVKDWTACRGYIANQSSKHDKGENEFLYASYKPIAIESCDDL